MSSLLEVLELPTGEIVLRRTDGVGEPLVEIKFSDEVRVILGEYSLDIGKAMLGAGMQAAGDVYGHEIQLHEERECDDVPGLVH